MAEYPTVEDIQTPEGGEAAAETSEGGEGAAAADASPGEPSGDQAEGTHYKTLEEADRAAREFQSKFDQLSPYEKLKQFGTADQIVEFINNFLPLTEREDFQDYRAGNLAPTAAKPNGEAGEGDEYLTDEQKEIRDLRATVAKLETRLNSGDQTTRKNMAAMRFASAAEGLDQHLDPAAWRKREPEMIQQIQKMAAEGHITDVNAITPELLARAHFSSFSTMEEMQGAIEHHAKWIAQRRAARQGQRETVLPTTPEAAPGDTPAPTPKSYEEALELGRRDFEAAQTARGA